MSFWLIYTYLIIILLILSFIYNLYLRRKLEDALFIEKEFFKFPIKFCIKSRNRYISNIEKNELDKYILEFESGIELGKNLEMSIFENGFYLEDREKNEKEDEIDKLLNLLEIEKRRLREEKDVNYYFYKEVGMKLSFIMQEITELKREVEKENPLLIKLENIESKTQFFINFIYGKYNITFYKYRLYTLENLVKLFEAEFKEKVRLRIISRYENRQKFYVEEEKMYLFVKAIFYSILKKVNEIIEAEIMVEKKLLVIIIQRLDNLSKMFPGNDEEFFEITGLKNSKWKSYLTGSQIRIEIPVREEIDEGIKEEKYIEITSDLKNIKTVEKNIIYDMYSKEFTEKEVSDTKLVIDELVTNAIEHGNQFDDSKKVLILYKFKESSDTVTLIIEIEDEGKGFSIEKLKVPDISGERGRGIFIVRKIVDRLEYFNDGKKVVVYKKRRKLNDSEKQL
ncbi:MAG: anti-sigma F factor [Candidatus Diapherotrites archaeon ADurb.Bin253]|nr:MAG: anti-sigma F factor [Candidatus Diapherotrites archaeon ADurb.Bin253]